MMIVNGAKKIHAAENRKLKPMIAMITPSESDPKKSSIIVGLIKLNRNDMVSAIKKITTAMIKYAITIMIVLLFHSIF